MAKLFANSGDPDQTPRSAASDLGLHCFPMTLLRSPEYNGLSHAMLKALSRDIIFIYSMCANIIFSMCTNTEYTGQL